ncbi:MAG: hypothetical protein QF442_01660 [Candidatus Peribacteraceae bacterium]|jgi:hypothetical protein|nr:hypothetical protein [Candidatus Peribacteraceae bacterium]
MVRIIESQSDDNLESCNLPWGVDLSRLNPRYRAVAEKTLKIEKLTDDHSIMMQARRTADGSHRHTVSVETLRGIRREILEHEANVRPIPKLDMNIALSSLGTEEV